MAIVMRRYQEVGPTSNVELARFVDATTPPTINTAYGRVTIDINYDNAVPSLVDDLDSYMASKGFLPTATMSPKQVFSYTCLGSEGAAFTINAAKGFIARLTANYEVQFSLCRPAANGIKVPTLVDGTFTTVQFGIELSAPAEAGDILCFTVEDKT